MLNTIQILQKVSLPTKMFNQPEGLSYSLSRNRPIYSKDTCSFFCQTSTPKNPNRNLNFEKSFLNKCLLHKRNAHATF